MNSKPFIQSPITEEDEYYRPTEAQKTKQKERNEIIKKNRAREQITKSYMVESISKTLSGNRPRNEHSAYKSKKK